MKLPCATVEIMNEFRDYMQTQIDVYSYWVSGHDIFIELEYISTDNDGDYGMIYNENELTIDSLYVYGYGVHYTLILNVDGGMIVFILDMIQINYYHNQN